MITMQYGFVLPADYDMTIIDRRIRDKGPMLDGFPRLRAKAYLSARKQDPDVTSAENLYAPFYLWDDPDGIDAFLSSPGFAALTRDFGWPVVRTGLVWHAALGPSLGEARFASRTITSIPPYADLASLRTEATAGTETAVTEGALAAVAAFDPTTWTRIAFTLWQDMPKSPTTPNTQLYRVGHVSLP